jgi:hypothetical protein
VETDRVVLLDRGDFNAELAEFTEQSRKATLEKNFSPSFDLILAAKPRIT